MDEGLEAVFRAEFPRLAGYCAGLVGDEGLGADLAQEAMVRTWGRWRSVREPRAYAYLVATNLARRHWSRRSREREAHALLAAGARSVDPGPDTGVRDLVERLPERLRVPAVLHYYADLPVDEVARLLRRPPGTIKQRLHQARAVLAGQLAEEEQR